MIVAGFSEVYSPCWACPSVTHLFKAASREASGGASTRQHGPTDVNSETISRRETIANAAKATGLGQKEDEAPASEEDSSEPECKLGLSPHLHAEKRNEEKRRPSLERAFEQYEGIRAAVSDFRNDPTVREARDELRTLFPN